MRYHQGHIIDLVATACSLAGADTTGLDGADLTSVWRDDVAAQRSEALCWEHQGHSAVRDGRWKIVRIKTTEAWELYDIDADRIEEQDLAKQHPDVVARLSDMWDAWAKRCGVLPWPLQKKAGAA
jgi:arylsulfatase